MIWRCPSPFNSVFSLSSSAVGQMVTCLYSGPAEIITGLEHRDSETNSIVPLFSKLMRKSWPLSEMFRFSTVVPGLTWRRMWRIFFPASPASSSVGFQVVFWRNCSSVNIFEVARCWRKDNLKRNLDFVESSLHDCRGEVAINDISERRQGLSSTFACAD